MVRLNFLLLILIVFSIEFAKAQTEIPNISKLKLIDEYVVPFNKSFKGTKVGGLSGIDYDAVNDEYYLICDDRSTINPARFYKAKIHFTEKGIDSVQFTDVHFLLQPDGSTYPSSKHDPKHTPDPESIRYNPKSKIGRAHV